MKMVRLRENVWINADKVVEMRFDAQKGLTLLFLDGAPEPITLASSAEEVLKHLTS